MEVAGTPTVIAIAASYHGVGKTTFARSLAYHLRLFEYKVEVVPFARHLKRAVQALQDSVGLRMPPEVSTRDLQIAVGLSCTAESPSWRHHDGLWARVMERTINESEVDYFIIDDLRFPAEYTMLAEKFRTEFVFLHRESRDVGNEVIAEGHLGGHWFHRMYDLDKSGYDGPAHLAEVLRA